ncbi:phosphatidylglycerophosphatase A family protein [Gimesia maris]|jgi:phosphatidylglycerophosphatase A|uniref:Phosphatidylglycerophosphatase A n=1 Tax=Gimesia maris TaxID=122 RepID=A0A3D3RBM7_9PLAN|nr:phosphatidylglycerophosphatase A [Gimesia sp.]HCO26264.1 phosphatidylglycerophosphatase A [Gimesia maris]|tara:strand:+ start:80531 stop:81022 length:492 start_codon:yes stop_codon:yes gene_type:complete
MRNIKKQTILLCATGLGIGWIPRAPGTFGSLLGPPLVAGLLWFHPGWPVYLLVSVIIFLLGVYFCDQGAKLLGIDDPGCIVFDEIGAFTVVLLPAFHLELNLRFFWVSVIGFLWFRLFDIWKPWPVRYFDRIHGGWGIMTDDYVAAVYAAICLYVTLILLGWF